mmetsp:Transcript_154575/g.495535  ORF Transcript_154575/g.495535 Transcript_154575/m.495535 type:complete len:244 (+) Transcript_154575:2504-3235(+)
MPATCRDASDTVLLVLKVVGVLTWLKLIGRLSSEGDPSNNLLYSVLETITCNLVGAKYLTLSSPREPRNSPQPDCSSRTSPSEGGLPLDAIGQNEIAPTSCFTSHALRQPLGATPCHRVAARGRQCSSELARRFGMPFAQPCARSIGMGHAKQEQSGLQGSAACSACAAKATAASRPARTTKPMGAKSRKAKDVTSGTPPKLKSNSVDGRPRGTCVEVPPATQSINMPKTEASLTLTVAPSLA